VASPNVCLPKKRHGYLKICATDAFNCREYIARYELSAALSATIIAYAKVSGPSHGSYNSDADGILLNDDKVFANSDLGVSIASSDSLKRFFNRFQHVWKACVKFLILSLVADPEYQRELDYMIRTQPFFVH
jgi:hypothetical protein